MAKEVVRSGALEEGDKSHWARKREIDFIDSTFYELVEALNTGTDVKMSNSSVALIMRGYLREWKTEEGITWKKEGGVFFFTPDGIADLLCGKYPEETKKLLDNKNLSKK